MSAIVVNDPLSGLAGALSPPSYVTGQSSTAASPLEASKTFATVFQNVGESVKTRQIDGEAFADDGLALPAEDVETDEIREVPGLEVGVAGAAALPLPATQPAPVSGDVPHFHVKPVATSNAEVAFPMGNDALFDLDKGFATPQDLSKVGEAGVRRTDAVVPLNTVGSQSLAPMVLRDDPADLDQTQGGGPSEKQGAEAEGAPSPRPNMSAADLRKGAVPDLGLPLALRIRGAHDRQGLPDFTGRHDSASDYDLQTGSKNILPQEIESIVGRSTSVEMGARQPHPTPPIYLAIQDVVLRAHAAEQAMEGGLQMEAATQEVLDLSEGRAPNLAGLQAVNHSNLSWMRSDVPQALAQQIAVAVQSRDAGKSTIDLRLAPKELGRVRLSLTHHEGVVTVNVSAERPETLDLLRRHVDALARGLLDVGYHEARFSFNGQDPQDGAGKAPVAHGAPHREDKDFSLMLDPAETLAVRATAMAGTRVNVLI